MKPLNVSLGSEEHRALIGYIIRRISLISLIYLYWLSSTQTKPTSLHRVTVRYECEGMLHTTPGNFPCWLGCHVVQRTNNISCCSMPMITQAMLWLCWPRLALVSPFLGSFELIAVVLSEGLTGPFAPTCFDVCGYGVRRSHTATTWASFVWPLLGCSAAGQPEAT